MAQQSTEDVLDLETNPTIPSEQKMDNDINASGLLVNTDVGQPASDPLVVVNNHSIESFNEGLKPSEVWRLKFLGDAKHLKHRTIILYSGISYKTLTWNMGFSAKIKQTTFTLVTVAKTGNAIPNIDSILEFVVLYVKEDDVSMPPVLRYMKQSPALELFNELVLVNAVAVQNDEVASVMPQVKQMVKNDTARQIDRYCDEGIDIGLDSISKPPQTQNRNPSPIVISPSMPQSEVAADPEILVISVTNSRRTKNHLYEGAKPIKTSQRQANKQNSTMPTNFSAEFATKPVQKQVNQNMTQENRLQLSFSTNINEHFSRNSFDNVTMEKWMQQNDQSAMLDNSLEGAGTKRAVEHILHPDSERIHRQRMEEFEMQIRLEQEKQKTVAAIGLSRLFK